jgi:hypothetical protein
MKVTCSAVDDAAVLPAAAFDKLNLNDETMPNFYASAVEHKRR